MKSTTRGEQKVSNSGRTPKGKQGPNKLDLLCNRNILEHATCHYVHTFSQVTLVLAFFFPSCQDAVNGRCDNHLTQYWDVLYFAACNTFAVQSLRSEKLRHHTVNFLSTIPILSQSIMGHNSPQYRIRFAVYDCCKLIKALQKFRRIWANHVAVFQPAQACTFHCSRNELVWSRIWKQAVPTLASEYCARWHREVRIRI